jgi:hypothetical protein
VSDRIEPVSGVRIEPARPLLRVERREREARDERREHEQEPQEEETPDEDDGLHIDVQA